MVDIINTVCYNEISMVNHRRTGLEALGFILQSDDSVN